MGIRAVFVYAPGDGNRTRQGAELRKCVSIFQRSTQGPKARSETRICEANPWTSCRPLHKIDERLCSLWDQSHFHIHAGDPTSPPKLRLNTDCLLAFANPLKSGVVNLGRGFLTTLAIGWEMWSKKPCPKMTGLVLSHESGPSTTFSPQGSTIAAVSENRQAVYQLF